MKALGTLLRYRAQIAREYGAAMRELDALRQRRLAQPQAERRSEPEPARRTTGPRDPAPAALPVPDEPERPLNRHQRRALAAMERKRAA